MCDRTSTGAASCWGVNPNGELGRGFAGGVDYAPAAVSGLGTAVDLALYYHSACAATVTGAVRCWGANDQGQPGDRATTTRNAPVLVLGL